MSSDNQNNLVVSLNNLFKELKQTTESVTPLILVNLLRIALPRFAESNNHGYLQQDAEECWGELISILRSRLPGLDAQGNIDAEKKFIQQWLTGEMTVT